MCTKDKKGKKLKMIAVTTACTICWCICGNSTKSDAFSFRHLVSSVRNLISRIPQVELAHIKLPKKLPDVEISLPDLSSLTSGISKAFTKVKKVLTPDSPRQKLIKDLEKQKKTLEKEVNYYNNEKKFLKDFGEKTEQKLRAEISTLSEEDVKFFGQNLIDIKLAIATGEHATKKLEEIKAKLRGLRGTKL